ncbi:hypothetical protein [Rhodoferax sp. GW822-FHT02A01]|uniref:hypothetical protein n=1 Tax=Rhodoferax sp. GW822-FHT02A01 TaxID=3141537 RepID=UPI00315E02E2
MSLRCFMKRAWGFLYPPYELLLYGPTDQLPDEDPIVTLFKSKKSVAPDVQQSHLAIAEAIYKSEIDRKKALKTRLLPSLQVWLYLLVF